MEDTLGFIQEVEQVRKLYVDIVFTLRLKIYHQEWTTEGNTSTYEVCFQKSDNNKKQQISFHWNGFFPGMIFLEMLRSYSSDMRFFLNVINEHMRCKKI